jgi:hypothetical protein
MAALTREGPSQFRVRFEDLARRGLGRLLRRDFVQVDPFLIGRAVTEVMGACTVRSATGRSLLWNDYRVVLARADFELLGALQGALDADIQQALRRVVAERDAELVGDLRVTIVVDEADELAAGHAVVRAAFVPTERLSAPIAGQMTVRFDEMSALHRELRTVCVGDTDVDDARYALEWAHGRVTAALEGTTWVGRPHPEPPERFIALEGASTKINKLHFTLVASPGGVTIARPPSANPVQVGDRALPAGEQIEIAPPASISLSNGDLVLALSRL